MASMQYKKLCILFIEVQIGKLCSEVDHSIPLIPPVPRKPKEPLAEK